MPSLPEIMILLINMASFCFQKCPDLDDKTHGHANAMLIVKISKT